MKIQSDVEPKEVDEQHEEQDSVDEQHGEQDSGIHFSKKLVEVLILFFGCDGELPHIPHSYEGQHYCLIVLQ